MCWGREDDPDPNRQSQGFLEEEQKECFHSRSFFHPLGACGVGGIRLREASCRGRRSFRWCCDKLGTGRRFSPSEPARGFIAAAGLQPSGNDQIYWFKGSYRGSPPFYVKLIRDGPHLEGFHLSYYWEVVAYTSPEKEMGEKTLSLHKTLIAWAKDDKTVYVPPGS
jgi:hypothetical protein